MKIMLFGYIITSQNVHPFYNTYRHSLGFLQILSVNPVMQKGGEQDASQAQAIPVIPTISIKIPVVKPSVPLLPLHTHSNRFHQILDSINDYHEDTHHNIEISLVTQRTAKYDKFKESQVTSRSKLVNIDERVTEEFSLVRLLCDFKIDLNACRKNSIEVKLL